MSKQKPKKTPAYKQEKESALSKFSINRIIPEKYQTIALILIILAIFLVYFSPMYFGGQTYQSGDIITSKSLRPYVEQEREGYTLWYPYIFGGMPAYALGTDYKWFNLFYVGITTVRSVFTAAFEAEYAMWTFYLLILAINMFFLVKHLTGRRLTGLFAGLSVSFSTGIILFLFIGHVTKLTALAWIPLIFLMLLKFQDKFKLRDFALLIIALQLSIQGWHVQIIFYMLFAVAIYFIFYFVRSLIKKQKPGQIQTLKAAGIFAGAFLIALLIQSDNLTQVYQYNPYSTRGSESIVEKQNPTAGQSDSEFYQYATNWSFSPQEVITFVIPSYFGFGNSTYDGPLAPQPVEVNTYFGQMPFVDVAMYMGVVVFFLGLFGMYAGRKNSFVQYLVVLIIISLLISFGRTFPVVYDLMFYYFPFFDKFRVPSMILVLVQLSFPILAAIGVKRIIDLRSENNALLKNIVKYAAFVFTGLFLIGLVGQSGLQDWMAGRVNEHASAMQNPRMAQQFQALADYTGEMFANDFMLVFLFSALVFWFAYLYIKKKLSADLMILAIIIVSMIDLVRIDNRGSKYQEVQDVESLFTEPLYVRIVKGQQDEAPFRIFNMKQDGSMGSFNQNSNFNAYFLLQDFYGYSSIKPRSYQDFIDVIGPVNRTMWRMLNVKYVVAGQQLPYPFLRQVETGPNTFVYENMEALPRAYFVDSLAHSEPFPFLQMVKNNEFDPAKTAFVYPDVNLDIDKPGDGAYVEVTEYKDEKITIEAKATGDNLLFLGDTYYPEGWHAYIDGTETEIYRVNHGYRGIIVPEGEHEIVFEYKPVTFTISMYLALILSALTLVALILGIWLDYRKQKSLETA